MAKMVSVLADVHLNSDVVSVRSAIGLLPVMFLSWPYNLDRMDGH